jgi:hypothetical protein
MDIKLSRSGTRNTDGRLFLFVLSSVAIIATLLAGGLVYWFWYLDFFAQSGPAGQQRYSQMGEFFGGTLGPLFSFFALLTLLSTIRLQSNELRHTRAELAKSARAMQNQITLLQRQTFDSMFFQLVRLHNDIIKDLTVQTGDRTYAGRDCFRLLFGELVSHLEEEEAKDPDREPREIINAAYQAFWDNYQSEFGHYFRSLYNILRIIDEQRDDIKDGPATDNSPARLLAGNKKYARAIRAQLSTFELKLLYYNCVWHIGGGKFRELIERYAMLDNLDTSRLPFPHDSELSLSLFAADAFGSSKSRLPRNNPDLID